MVRAATPPTPKSHSARRKFRVKPYTRIKPKWRRHFLTVLVSLALLLALFAVTKTTLLLLFDAKPHPEQTHHYPIEADGAEYMAYLPTAASRPPVGLPGDNRILSTAPEGELRMMIMLDYWERMINVQSALRRLVQIAVEADFTVVEPLMYESKAGREYAFPELFERKDMVPQTADLYFQTKRLYDSGRYISHQEFRRRIKSLATKRGFWERLAGVGRSRYHIDTAVFIDWDNTSKRNDTFYWCDNTLNSLWMVQRSSYSLGWRLARNIYVQRALCLSPKATLSPVKFTRKLFDDMFEFVRAGTERRSKQCPNCLSLAFFNYRKHAFSGFVTETGESPMAKPDPSLPVGNIPTELAKRLHQTHMGGQKYVALQIRTGKPFVLLGNYVKKRRGSVMRHRIDQHAAFKVWLSACTTALVSKAQDVAMELGPETRFYIASDMYNDGWKGGDNCPWWVKPTLRRTKEYLSRNLPGLQWVKPETLGIEQDEMGMAGVVDAAVCARADRFIYANPSNFGNWVAGQRGVNGKNTTFTVNCNDERFD